MREMIARQAAVSPKHASAEDFLVTAFEFILGCEVVYRGVQADVVVINGVFVDDAASFFERKRHGDPDAFALEGLVMNDNYNSPSCCLTE